MLTITFNEYCKYFFPYKKVIRRVYTYPQRILPEKKLGEYVTIYATHKHANSKMLVEVYVR